MGNQPSGRGAGNSSTDFTDISRDSAICFHRTHSENVQLFNNKRRAKRVESFCKGIAFSSRPVAIGERVYIKFAEISTSWSGVLRFGFTSRDPATLNSSQLPRYACPDLTNRPGFWAKALSERYAETNCILYFYVTRNGEVNFGVNGEEKGLFFSGVNTSSPLWPLIDIYGNTIAMEFIDPRQAEASVSRHPAPEGIRLSSMRSLSLRNTPEPEPESNTKYHGNVSFTSFPFHHVKGRNINMNMERTVASRVVEEYCNAYVFTDRPIRCGQKIVVQILGVDKAFTGGLAFGVTACDPATISASELPDDSDNLLDRPEYWVVNKDVCTGSEKGDELSFTLSNEGEIHFGKNGFHVSVLMHVDKTLPLWLFFDVYGNTQKVKILGLAGQRLQRHSVPNPGLRVVLPPPPAVVQASGASGGSPSTSVVKQSGAISGTPPTSMVKPSGAVTEGPPAIPPRLLTPQRNVSAPTGGAIVPPILEPRTINLSATPPPVDLPLPLLPVPIGTTNTTTSSTANTSKVNTPNTLQLDISYGSGDVSTNISPTAIHRAGASSGTPGRSVLAVKVRSTDNTPLTPMSALSTHASMSSMDLDNAQNNITDYDSNECTVCYERVVDCVLYTCGHMCMCYDCAIDVKNERGALCPICRQVIKDIIRTYRS